MAGEHRTGIRLEGDASGYRAASEDAVRATRQLDDAQQQLATGSRRLSEAQQVLELGMRRQRTEANLLANANRMLPAQITDIVTSIQGGMNPLTIFIQQGGQIRDMYGGVGNALRAVGSLVTPTVLGFGAMAAGAGVLAFAAKSAHDEISAIDRAVSLLGPNAQLSAGGVQELADSLAFSKNSTPGAVRETIAELMKAGAVSQQALEDATRASLAIQTLTGEDASKVAQTLGKAGDDVVAFTSRMNAAYGFMTAEQFKVVVQLAEQRRQSEAVRLVMGQLADTMEQRVGRSMTWLDGQVIEHNQAWAKLWATIKGFVTDQTIEQRLAQLGKQLTTATALSLSATDTIAPGEWARDVVGDKIEGFQLKRIRSGVETLLAANGVSREVRGHLQSHGLTGVQARHYNGHDYMPEKRQAIEILVREVCQRETETH